VALDSWSRGQSTRQLISVQLGDTRDEVVKALKSVAELEVDEHVDLGRQRFLTDTMTRLVTDLDAANAAVRGVGDSPDPMALRSDLLAMADLLAGGYR
jgi:hypothetical protein